MRFTDEQLRQCLESGMSNAEIAMSFRVSPSAVTQRTAKLEKKALAKTSPQVAKAVASCWDIRAAAEENYQRAIALLVECEDAGDKVRTVAEIRNHLQFAMSIIEALYNTQEVQAFMEEVLTVVEECEPGSRERILSRIREKRAIRAAFRPV